MNEFKNYHPLVNFIYFLCVIIFSCIFMHPVCLLVSFAASFAYSIVLEGRNALKTLLAYSIPLIILTALINTLFNHEGVTILTYFPNGNPLTLESVVYGFAAAVMILSVVCWFSCCNRIITSDKFIYLFGKIIPSLSLILSMTFRFVPRFGEQFKKVADAQKCIGRDISSKGFIHRIKCAVSIMSVMITWALENSVETADSMKSRGYGLPGRTAFSIFKFTRRDKIALICILTLSIYIVLGSVLGKMQFHYFPSMEIMKFSVLKVSVFIGYFLLSVMPLIIEFCQVLKWKFVKSKM